MLFISYIAPIVPPAQSAPHPTYSNCKRFSSSVSYRYMSSIYHILSSYFTLPLPLWPSSHPHLNCAYFTVLVFIINIWVDIQRGASMYAHCGCALLWSVQSFSILSLTPLPSTPCFSTSFNTYSYILYLHILWYEILLLLYHYLFLSLFPIVQ
jgi:hypothetical protein